MDYYPLNTIFSQKDLYWLDSLMPGSKKKVKEALRKKQRRRGKCRTFGCCGSRRKGKPADEDLMNDANMAPMEPDIVLNIEEEMEKKPYEADGGTITPTAVDQSESLATTLEPLLDNGTSTGVNTNN